MKPTGIDAVPEEVLQRVLQRVNFDNKQADAEPPTQVLEIFANTYI